MSAQSLRISDILMLLLLATLWGSSYLLIKIAVMEIPPLTLITIRCVIATLILGTVLIWQRISLPRELTIWGKLGVQSLLSCSGAWTILAWGQQYIDSGLASVLNSTSPLFVIFFTILITRHEPVSSLKCLGGFLGISGVVLIIGIDAMSGLGQHVLGQLAVLGGATLYALAAIYGKQFSKDPAIASATGTLLCASLLLIPSSLIADQPWTLQAGYKSITSAILLGVFCTGLALVLYFHLIKSIGSLGVASQSYLRVGIGVALGVIFLDEKISVVVGLGILLAVVGVMMINFPLNKRS